MRHLPFILLILNLVLLIPASIALLGLFRLIPDLASWPNDLIVHNQSGQLLKITPICVGPDGSPRHIRLFPDRETQRMLERPGGWPIAPGATANWMFDRENSELIAVIVEDAQGRLRQQSVPPVEPPLPIMIEIGSIDALGPMSPAYKQVFAESQQTWRQLMTPLAWFILPFLSIVPISIAFRRAVFNATYNSPGLAPTPLDLTKFVTRPPTR